jgi:hypothetical protein
MRRGNVVVSSVIIVLGATALPSYSAEQTFKQQIQGAWNLVSCDAKTPICVNPSGSISYNGNGRYTLVVTAKDRPKATHAAGTTRENVPPDYYKAIAQGVVANFGTWSVNEADKTITSRSEGALFPNGIGNEAKTTVVSVTADEMKTNGAALGNTVWRRFK